MCGQVVSEPVVRDASENGEALIADLGIRGVWQPQTMALFDIRLTDTDAKSYLSHSPRAVLAFAEADKKKKYCDACIVPPSHPCVSRWIVLLVMRPPVS